MADYIGYTKVPNDVIEGLSKLPLNGTQYRIILVVIRYTLGFQREEHALSETFLAKATNVGKRQIQRELNKLINLNILTVEKTATFKTSRVIKFNRCLESYQLTNTTPDGELDTSPDDRLDTSPGGELDTQETKVLKENIKEKGGERFNPFKRPLETPEQAELRKPHMADFHKALDDLRTKGVGVK